MSYERLETALPVAALAISGLVAKFDPTWFILGWCIGDVVWIAFKHFRNKHKMTVSS